MTAGKRRAKPQTVTLWKYGACTGAAKGPARTIHPILQRLGVKWMWDAAGGHYLLPIQRLDDLAAALELDGHHIDMRMPAW